MSGVLAITLNPALDLSIGVDELVPGTLHRAREAATVAAGKGHNVACVLAALGHEVTVAGFLGDENDGAGRAGNAPAASAPEAELEAEAIALASAL